LIQSNQKSSQQKCFFALLAFALQNGQNHGLQLFCATSFAQSYASAKTCYAPAIAQATIVLPAFARSLSADGKRGSVFNQ
jgi:hypothetical protein